MNRKKTINEVVDINGSKVFVEDGEVKTVLSEEIQRTGWITVEESREITLEAVKWIYMQNGKI
jgi:hypothetical protein